MSKPFTKEVDMKILINGIKATQADLIALHRNLEKGKDRIKRAQLWKGTLMIETV